MAKWILLEDVRVPLLGQRLDLLGGQAVAKEELGEEELLAGQLPEQVLRLVAVDALALRVEARRRRGFPLRGLVEDELDAGARLDDADLWVWKGGNKNRKERKVVGERGARERCERKRERL